MNFTGTTPTTHPNISKDQTLTSLFQRLSYYIIVCAGIGSLGGATGTALAIGLAIIIQSLLSPTTIFLPGVIPLSIVAVLLGLGASWIFSRVTHHFLPSISFESSVLGLQITLIFSGLISLLETALFMHGL